MFLSVAIATQNKKVRHPEKDADKYSKKRYYTPFPIIFRLLFKMEGGSVSTIALYQFPDAAQIP